MARLPVPPDVVPPSPEVVRHHARSHGLRYCGCAGAVRITPAEGCPLVYCACCGVLLVSTGHCVELPG